MFIFWKKSNSKKNKPPRQPEWYVENWYAYLRENKRDERGRHQVVKNIYLGRVKKTGGEMSTVHRAVFYMTVEEKLDQLGFTVAEKKEIVELLNRAVHYPEVDVFQRVRQRRAVFYGPGNHSPLKS